PLVNGSNSNPYYTICWESSGIPLKPFHFRLLRDGLISAAVGETTIGLLQRRVRALGDAINAYNEASRTLAIFLEQFDFNPDLKFGHEAKFGFPSLPTLVK